MHPFYLYEVFNSDPEEIKWKKLESQSLLQEGIHHYRNKNFLQAKNLFFEVLKILPSDPIAQIYIERIQYFLKNPPPSDWQGIWKFTEK